MNRERQIEEMAVILTDGGCTKCNCDENGKFNCLPMYNAGLLYNAGYRKQSEIVKEIFEEIERILSLNYCCCLLQGATEHYEYYEGNIAKDIAELKKKYGVEVEE